MIENKTRRQQTTYNKNEETSLESLKSKKKCIEASTSVYLAATSTREKKKHTEKTLGLETCGMRQSFFFFDCCDVNKRKHIKKREIKNDK